MGASLSPNDSSPPPRVNLEGLTPDPAALEAVPARVAHHYGFFPYGWEGERLKVAVAEWPAAARRDEWRLVVRRDVLPALASAEDIQRAIKNHYGLGSESVERLSTEAVPLAVETRRRDDLDAAADASVIKIVNQLLLEAHDSRATDIHLEPYENDFRVRYRIDGVLYDAKTAEGLNRHRAAIVSRIKIMAELSIAEKRLPQDGRLRVRVGGQDLDLRVSTLPTPFGESVGVRLLTRRQFLDLRHLGFEERDAGALAALLEKPHGIVFLTGPTGSGKTTTLYAFLNQLNRPDKKIITIEDPIEYEMRGVTQVQVQPSIGLTFAQGLRSMLRHDPDVMMVGEVRDLETAEIAVRVALTGHLVFSTLHTNDAASAATRLQDIGVEPYLIASSVLCVIAQRLVRVICENCRESAAPPPEMTRECADAPGSLKAFRGRGCAACKGTGYRGRTVIYERMPMTDALRNMIVDRRPAHVLRDEAVRSGLSPLRQSGWRKVMDGVTTADEVLRATLREGI